MLVFRCITYAVIGILLGIFDWYYLELLTDLPWPHTTIATITGIGVNWGIWLVPAVPTAAIEMTRSRRVWLSALAGSIVWFCAICAYYIYYGFLMASDGQSPLSFIEATHAPVPNAWQEWWRITQTLTIGDIRDWGGLAIIGGACVGASAGILTKIVCRREQQNHVATPTRYIVSVLNPSPPNTST